MKERRSVVLSISTLAQLKKLPISRSEVVCESILHAARKPDVLAEALRLRLYEPQDHHTQTVTYTRSPELGDWMKKLTEMSRLSSEETLRLCIEAFIRQL